MTVQKRITPWSKYCKFWSIKVTDIRRVYSKTANSAGLVHVCGASGPRVAHDAYTVELKPVGLQRSDALPATEKEARAAAHGLLHGLHAIHTLVW